MISGTNQYEGLIVYHQRMVTALRTLADAYGKVSNDSKSGFYQYTETAFFKALEGLRAELDQQVVLMLVASAEAMIRRDFVARVQGTTTETISVRFRILRKKYTDYSDDDLHRVSFEAILDGWKEIAADTTKIGAIKPLYRRRHWLAHGRYWTDTSGTQATPRDAQRFIEAFIVEIQSVCPDFPRNI